MPPNSGHVADLLETAFPKTTPAQPDPAQRACSPKTRSALDPNVMLSCVLRLLLQHLIALSLCKLMAEHTSMHLRRFSGLSGNSSCLLQYCPSTPHMDSGLHLVKNPDGCGLEAPTLYSGTKCQTQRLKIFARASQALLRLVVMP